MSICVYVKWIVGYKRRISCVVLVVVALFQTRQKVKWLGTGT